MGCIGMQNMSLVVAPLLRSPLGMAGGLCIRICSMRGFETCDSFCTCWSPASVKMYVALYKMRDSGLALQHAAVRYWMPWVPFES